MPYGYDFCVGSFILYRNRLLVPRERRPIDGLSSREGQRRSAGPSHFDYSFFSFAFMSSYFRMTALLYARMSSVLTVAISSTAPVRMESSLHGHTVNSRSSTTI